MAVISGVPSRDWDKNPLPPDQMVATRKFVNDLAGSRRVLSHGLLRPNLGKPELEEMERQVKDLKIDAWKMYTGAEIGEKAWFMDDEKVAYPVLGEDARSSASRTCASTRGCRWAPSTRRPARRSTWRRPPRTGPTSTSSSTTPASAASAGSASGTGDQGRRPQEQRSAGDPLDQRHPAHPQDETRKIKNIYFELGSTFNMTVVVTPRDAACTCSAR